MVEDRDPVGLKCPVTPSQIHKLLTCTFVVLGTSSLRVDFS